MYCVEINLTAIKYIPIDRYSAHTSFQNHHMLHTYYHYGNDRYRSLRLSDVIIASVFNAQNLLISFSVDCDVGGKMGKADPVKKGLIV